MKVLVITNLYPPEVIGGYEVQCSQAVADLRQRGHDVSVLTSVPRRPLIDADPDVLRLLRTPDVYSGERADIRSPFWEFESNLLNPENIHILLQVLADVDPDVCYLWNLVAIGGAAIVGALELVDAPWVWHLGDSVPSMLCNLNGQLPDLGAMMGARFSGRFLACSRTVVDRVEQLVPITGRTRIVPNWVTGTQPSVDRKGFDGTFLKGVFAGRVAEEKGVFLLPEIAARLRDSGHTNFSLEVIGTGLVRELAERVAEFDVASFVDLVGWVPPDEVRDRLFQSDVFVFPTFSGDSMPLAPLQAASVGCVPLLPTASGVSEWLVDNVHCLKAERTAEGFAHILARIMDGEIELDSLSKITVRAVHDDFAIEKAMPVVETELVLAAEAKRIKPDRFEDVYRMALITDALLRRQVVEQAQHRGGTE